MNQRSTNSGRGNGHGSSTRAIERNIEQTRSEMDQTLDELGERLNPRNLLDQAIDKVRSNISNADTGEMSQQAQRVGKQVVRKMKEHPIPTLLCAAGIAWFLFEESQDDDERDFHSQWADIPEHSGSFVDARTGEPYDESYGREWRGAAWSKNYDWSQSEHSEETWSRRAEGTLSELKTTLSDASLSARDKLRSTGARLMGLSGNKRQQIHDQWANLREHSGSYVDARTGEPYDESYIRECEALMACDFAASHDWSQEDEQSWSEKAQHALEEMQTMLSDTTHSVKDRVSALASKVGEFMGSTGDASSRYGESIRQGARQAMSGARRGAARMGRRMQRGYGYSQHRIEDAMHEAPLAVGAACLGLGLVAGLLLPSTRQEDRLMGDASDQLKRRAKEVGQEAMQRGQHIASATANAAMGEMDRQGLNPDQLAQSVKSAASGVMDHAKEQTSGMQTAGEKISSVASAAIQTAKEETRKAAHEMRG